MMYCRWSGNLLIYSIDIQYLAGGKNTSITRGLCFFNVLYARTTCSKKPIATKPHRNIEIFDNYYDGESCLVSQIKLYEYMYVCVHTPQELLRGFFNTCSCSTYPMYVWLTCKIITVVEYDEYFLLLSTELRGKHRTDMESPIYYLPGPGRMIERNER